jgi:hypothetical protein
MSDSSDLFSFLNDVWELLPDQDKLVFGETWKAWEQCYGNIYTKLFERSFGSYISTVPLYNNTRWLQHEFDSTTQVNLSASFRSTTDVSHGLDLSSLYLIRFSVNDGPQIEVNLQGIDPNDTLSTEIVAKFNQAAGIPTFVSLVVGGALLQFTSPTAGPTSNITFYPASIPAADASLLVLGLAISDLPESFPKFPYSFQLGDQFIVHIPQLTDTIHPEDATTVLYENTDYSIQFNIGIISFAVAPPAFMWAPDSLVNLETPYNNFGYLMEFYAPNTPGYLKAVQGLWFAYWTGPRPENIRRSLYLLLGLPVASKAGTVTSITGSTIVLTYTDNSTETFTIPTGLVSVVGVGETLTQYQPLVNGVTVLDKINSPGFVAREIGRGGIQHFLTQFASRGPGPDTDETKALLTIEQNAYLPQIDVSAFISPDISLDNIQTFLRNIQPKSRTYLFQILIGSFRDQIGEVLGFQEALELAISFDVTPTVDYNPNTLGYGPEWDDAETNPDTGLVLDSEYVGIGDLVGVDVYHGATLVDTFELTG